MLHPVFVHLFTCSKRKIKQASRILHGLLDTTVTEYELVQIIKDLNAQSDLHGILVQLPLPAHIDEQAIIKTIDPKKDVDGFHPLAVGSMMLQQDALLLCTPLGVIK